MREESARHARSDIVREKKGGGMLGQTTEEGGADIKQSHCIIASCTFC